MRALPPLMLRIWSVRALEIAILRVRSPLTIPVPVLIGTMRVRVAIIVVMMVMMVMIPIGKGSGCGQQDAAPEEKGQEGFLEESCHILFLSVLSLLLPTPGHGHRPAVLLHKRLLPYVHLPPHEKPQYFKDFISRAFQTQQ
jgi:hypothetical protein